MTLKFKDLAGVPDTPPTDYVGLYNNAGVLYWITDAGVTTSIASGTGDLKADGTIPLTANWDVGSFKITAQQLESDVATGTAPLVVASTTQVDNLTSEWTSKALAVVEPCRNESGAPLTKGTPVYISGYSVGQDLILVTGADADSASTMPCIGLVAADIGNNANGYVVIEGDINGVDTSTYTVGDALYVSGTAGALTATRPTGTALIQEVAVVLRVHATLGVLQVIPGSEVQGLPNLPENNVWVGNASATPTATDAAGLRTLLNVEDGADVTDTANVTAAGALMESEVTNLAAVKAFDPSDYGTAAAVSANTTNIAAPIHTLHVETVANQDYVLSYDMPFAGTITTLRAKTESGTCTVTGYINGVALGGTACSAATTADEQAHASANAYSKGDEIKITVTSNSSAIDLEVTFYGTRTDL